MIKLTDLITEALPPTIKGKSDSSARKHFGDARELSVRKLNRLADDVDFMTYKQEPEQQHIGAMKHFVTSIEKLERDFDRLKAKLK